VHANARLATANVMMRIDTPRSGPKRTARNIFLAGCANSTKTGKTSSETVTAVLVHHDTDLYDLKVKTGADALVREALAAVMKQARSVAAALAYVLALGQGHAGELLGAGRSRRSRAPVPAAGPAVPGEMGLGEAAGRAAGPGVRDQADFSGFLPMTAISGNGLTVATAKVRAGWRWFTEFRLPSGPQHSFITSTVKKDEVLSCLADAGFEVPVIP
jgi:hypothetical protein